MKRCLFFVLVALFLPFISFSQDLNVIPVKVYAKGKSLRSEFNIYLIRNDSMIVFDSPFGMIKNELVESSVGFTHKGVSFLIEKVNQNLTELSFYLDKKSFKLVTGERIDKPSLLKRRFRRIYNVDFGIDDFTLGFYQSDDWLKKNYRVNVVGEK